MKVIIAEEYSEGDKEVKVMFVCFYFFFLMLGIMDISGLYCAVLWLRFKLNAL